MIDRPEPLTLLGVRHMKSYRRDIKRLRRSHYDIDKLEHAIYLLRTRTVLPAIYKQHKLKGVYAEFEECHIGPDWLLVYKKTADLLVLAGTGTHAELFKK